MNRSNSQLKRSWIKRGSKELKRTEFIKRRRTEEMRRANAKAYRLRSKPETSAMKKFKREVRERDNYTCQFPGCQVYDLHIDVHHIAKRSQRPDLKLVVSNGICLCRQHHDWTDLNHDEAVRLGLLSLETYEKARRAA